MNALEFKKWFAAHRAAFPGIDRQLADMASNIIAIDGERITSADVLKSWKDTLADLPLPACLEATKRLAKGEQEYPRFLEDHPRLMRAVAKTIQLEGGPKKPPGPIRDREGNDRAECVDCLDFGVITIFSLDTMREVRDGQDAREGWKPKSCAIRCHCKWGRFYFGMTKGNESQGALFFQRDRMPPCEWRPTSEDVERLREFVNSNGRSRREPAFDEWNNS
jgi:hypothetical protein